MQVTKELLNGIITEIHDDYLNVHRHDWQVIADKVVDDFIEPNIYWKDSHKPFNYDELYDIIMEWRKQNPRII